MKTMQVQQADDEVQRVHANCHELATRIAGAIRDDGTAEPMKGLHLQRASSPAGPIHGMIEPSLCVIAQGSKVILLGNTPYRYDPAHYLLATAELPCIGQISDATPEHPYLSLRLQLDPTLVGSVMIEAGHLAPQTQTLVRALDVSVLDASLLDAVVRFVRLLDAPSDARFLAPLITREIIYRLLIGEQNGRLRQIAAISGDFHRIAEAIERIRHDFDQPLHIEDLARAVSMSVSSFHHHFKVVTAMSPLQFQKQLRLQEARRLLLGEHLDAASAGYRVGYEDASHFTREYKRLFGAPPMHDVERMREAVMAGASTEVVPKRSVDEMM
ncbi:MAG: AraC family transcriptional regulator [Ktedonobacterales bacterium]|nr:AraC family transcriptional regulator [Ktedonobacterales bacterium]